MQDSIVYAFFQGLPNFFHWMFPLNLITVIDFIVAMWLEGTMLRNGKKWWALPMLFLGMEVLFEILVKFMDETGMLMFSIFGFFVIAALAGSLIFLVVYTIWKKVRHQ